MTKATRLATLLFLICPKARSDDLNFEIRIDCESGAVDSESSMLMDLTDAQCQSACMHEKCNEATTLEEAEECLTAESLLGCLFSVNQMRSVQPQWCVTTHSEGKDDAISIVLEVNKDDLTQFGNGSLVQNVFLSLGIQNSGVSCTSQRMNIGHSLDPFDKAKCPYSGKADIEQIFSLADNTITAEMTRIFKGLYESDQDIAIFAELDEPSCQISVEAALVIFAVQYRTGYSPDVSCLKVQTCNGCLANGCHWCDWSKTVNFFLPDFLPDWDMINAAREKNKGICGLNSAACRMTLGSLNHCSAPATMSAMSALRVLGVFGLLVIAKG